MNLTIELSDELGTALKAQAHAQGLSPDRYVSRVLETALTSKPEISKRGSVVEEMRKLRARIKPDPEGWTTRDYVNCGRR